MKITIINASSGARLECAFECFHGGRKSPWAEVRFGLAGVYCFSLNTGWQEARKGQPQDWYVEPSALVWLRNKALDEKVKFVPGPIQAPQRTSAKPRKSRGKQAAPTQQGRLFE